MTWLKDVPEWLAPTLLTPLVLGIGWLFKTRRDDRLAERAAYEAKIEALQAKVESLLNDAIAREKESTKAVAEDAEMSRQRIEVWRTTNEVLAQLARALAKKDTGA